MTTKSYLRGHEIYYDNKKKVWRYADNDRQSEATNRECPRCRRKPNYCTDPDPCLRTLAGVTNACCGHGVKDPYFVLENGELTHSIERVLEFQEKGK